MLVEVTLLLGAILLGYYFQFKKRANYWKNLGVKQVEGNAFPFGTNPVFSWKVISGQQNLVDLLTFIPIYSY